VRGSLNTSIHLYINTSIHLYIYTIYPSIRVFTQLFAQYTLHFFRFLSLSLSLSANPTTHTMYTFESIPRTRNNVSQTSVSSSGEKSKYRDKMMMSDSRVMSLFDMKVPERTHIPVDLSAHLVEEKNKPEVCEVSIQTDAFKKRPPTPPYVPVKTGVDASTQIEPEDYENGYIFDFDSEVEPIVNVIVYKTMEQALIEVRQEQELISLRRRRDKIEYDNNTEYLKVRWLEEKERSDWLEKQKRMEIERQRLRTERIVKQKIVRFFLLL